MSEQLENLTHELVRLTGDKKTIDNQLNSVREQMLNTMIQENLEEFEFLDHKIIKVDSSIQTRTVNKETLINLLSEKINDSCTLRFKTVYFKRISFLIKPLYSNHLFEDSHLWSCNSNTWIFWVINCC